MKKIFQPLSWLLLLWWMGSAVAFADDTKYDLYYDRPTYFPDFRPPTDHPNNMSYFTCAHVGRHGERMTNYEVAVYDQDGKLRCTGRSIAEDDYICTLTIRGTEGETFHFRVLYGDFENPTIVDVPETCEFITNDIVGSRSNPYWLTLPVPRQLNYWLTLPAAADEAPTGTITAETADDAAEWTQARTAACLQFVGDWQAGDLSDGALTDCAGLCYVDFETADQMRAVRLTDANSNCLYYLPAEEAEGGADLSDVAAGWTNVVVGDEALTDIRLLGGTAEDYRPFHCPRAFSLAGHTATYERDSWTWADGQSGWNSLVLPFAASL